MNMSKKDADELPNESIEFEVSSIEFMENADTEILAKIGITAEEMKQDLLQQARAKQQQYIEMWNEIELHKAEIFAVTDAELAAENSKSISKLAFSRGNWSSSFFAYPWYNKKKTGTTPRVASSKILPKCSLMPHHKFLP